MSQKVGDNELLNISKLSEIFRIDRRTTVKYLADMKPFRITQTETLYYAPVAIRLIRSKQTGQEFDQRHWIELIHNILTN